MKTLESEFKTGKLLKKSFNIGGAREKRWRFITDLEAAFLPHDDDEENLLVVVNANKKTWRTQHYLNLSMMSPQNLQRRNRGLIPY